MASGLPSISCGVGFNHARIYRDLPAYVFRGRKDGTREVPEDITDKESYDRLSGFFTAATEITNKGLDKPYHFRNPPPLVCAMIAGKGDYDWSSRMVAYSLLLFLNADQR